MSELRKSLSTFDLTMIAVGATIGSGIFLTPQSIAEALPNSFWILVIWMIGGVIALTGALTFSELNGRFPSAGGIYVYLREGYGPLAGFLYGWAILTVVTTGALAALSLGFVDYANYLITTYTDYELNSIGKQLFAITALIALTGINLQGAKAGGVFASLFTVLKIVGIVALIGFGLGWGMEEQVSFSPELAEEPKLGFFGAAAAALVGVLWSFGGWQHATYLSGEARGGGRSVAKAMVMGTLIIAAIYLLTNIAYFYLLPIEDIAKSDRVAADAVETILGPIGGSIIAVIIFVSMFGTTGIYTMTAPRIYYAMSKDGVFFKQLSFISKSTGVPTLAVIIQTAWAIVLILFWGTFNDLINYVVFTDFLFMIFAAAAIFKFRAQSQSQGFKTPLYPIVPMIFIGILVWFVSSMLFEKPKHALAGLILLGCGTLVFYLRKYLNERKN